MAQEHDGILQQCGTYAIDELALSPEPATNDEENNDDDANPISDGLQFISRSKVLAAPVDIQSEGYTVQKIDKKTARINVWQGKTFELALDFSLQTCCSACGKENQRIPFYHGRYLGAPFYVTHAIPTVLEFRSDAENDPQLLSARGRRLVTFTDSHQGTARMAVKMQQEAGYFKLRGVVFDILARGTGGAEAMLPELVALMQASPDLVASIQANPASAEQVL